MSIAGSSGAGTGTAKASGTTRALLITPDDLQHRLGSENLVIIEVVSQDDVKKAPARIPGSQRVWRPDYQRPIDSTQPLDGLAPTPEAFGDFAQSLGISDDTEVVILSRKYDETRLWWLFTAFGKRLGPHSRRLK